MLSPVWMITTLTYSSVQVAALSVISQLIVPRTALNAVMVCCFVNGWMIRIVSGFNWDH
jgi:hypothetical protein